MEDEARIEAAHIVKRIEDEAREQANKQAQRIIGMAIQRAASDYVSETTVSVVDAPHRRHEGAHHRPRGAQHPRPGDGDRRRPDRRRHAGGGDPLRLRSVPPRDRPRRARAPDRRRPHPSGPHRGDRREGQGRSSRRRSSRRARRRCSSSASPASTRSWSSCSGACATAPPTARTCSMHSQGGGLPRRHHGGRAQGQRRRSPSRGGLLHDIGKAIDREMDGTHLADRHRPAAQVRRDARRSSTPWPATTATTTRRRSRRCW